MRIQRLAGNQAVQQMLAAAATPAAVAIQRKVEKIGDEEVEVKNDAEKAEAEAIIKRIKDTFGVEVSSATTIAGIKNEYTSVKAKVTNKLKARKWRMIELRSLEKALKMYAAILGAKRAESTRAGADQEVTSVGKVKQAINADTPAGKLDTSTLGEYFSTKKNMGLFKASEGYKATFGNEGDELVATFVHEIAHGLLAYAQADFIAKTGYWKDEYTKLARAKRKESPPTSYGRTNAAEDMCETAAYFFIKPKSLEKRQPKRYAWMEKIGKDWLPPPAAAPQVTPAPEAVPKADAVKEALPALDAIALVDDILANLQAIADKFAEAAAKSPAEAPK